MFQNNKDEEELARLVAQQHRHGASTTTLATTALLPRHQSLGGIGAAVRSPNRSPLHHVTTPWECESTTPMTTRPHFTELDAVRFLSPPLLLQNDSTDDATTTTSSRYNGRTTTPTTSKHQRQRSQSLGSAFDRDGQPKSTFWQPPPLGHGYGSCQLPATTPELKDSAIHKNGPILTDTTTTSNNSASAYEEEPMSDTAAADSTTATNPLWMSILYGLINATMVLPVTMSFGSIIYRDDALAPYMPIFVKLTIASGVVHQMCFSTFSTLPFAVGQVQDAGLIFLSTMASNIVKYCQTHNHTTETMLATVTVGLSLATLLLGFGLLIVGQMRLAEYMQLLPTSVVGGYLAFIGFFCGRAGIGLMVGSSDLTYSIVAAKWVYVLPGVIGGVLVYLTVTRLRHMATLPVSILFEIALFYCVLWITGTSVQEATTLGWIRDMDPEPVWYDSWKFLRLDLVEWTALPRLILTEWLAMLFVCALSSSLDVAALELELNRPLDYNHELKMIGLSNVLSGATGGYTGSYIFSQSIFSLRAGIRSRVAGYVLAICEIVYIVLPFPILSYVPNFFFGSLLCLISIDLMYEWLWDIRIKLTIAEYIICLATFVFINLLKVEYGILVGLGLYLACRKLGVDVGGTKFSHPTVVDTTDNSEN